MDFLTSADLILVVFSSVSFLFYGVNCLRSEHLKNEFRRFGLSNKNRKLTGVLQIFGGLGLLLGIIYPGIGFLSAVGLTTLMLLGLGVRIKVKDGLIKSFPALFFMLLNLYLSVEFWNELRYFK